MLDRATIDLPPSARAATPAGLSKAFPSFRPTGAINSHSDYSLGAGSNGSVDVQSSFFVT